MPSKLTTVTPPKLDTLRVAIQAPNLVRLSGTVTLREPGPVLGGFLKALHQAAVDDRLSELRLDITELTFVNSSAIRLFADWTTWLKNLPAAQRYRLTFLTSRKLTWQKSCFSALLVIAKDVLVVQDAA
jgi:hypothetical protein